MKYRIYYYSCSHHLMDISVTDFESESKMREYAQNRCNFLEKCEPIAAPVDFEFKNEE